MNASWVPSTVKLMNLWEPVTSLRIQGAKYVIPKRKKERMKRIFALTLVALSSIAAQAATPTKIVWTWNPGAANGVTTSGYNLYVSSAACSASYAAPAADRQNSAGLISGTTTNTPYTASFTGCAYVSAVNPMGVESAPSAGFPINTNAPSVPTGLVGTPQ